MELVLFTTVKLRAFNSPATDMAESHQSGALWKVNGILRSSKSLFRGGPFLLPSPLPALPINWHSKLWWASGQKTGWTVHASKDSLDLSAGEPLSTRSEEGRILLMIVKRVSSKIRLNNSVEKSDRLELTRWHSYTCGVDTTCRNLP